MFFVFNEESPLTSENQKSLSKEESDKLGLKRKFFSLVGLVLVVAIIGGLIGSFILPMFFGLNPVEFYQGKPFAIFEKQAKPPEEKPAPYITDPVIAVAGKVQPSVVNIRTEKTISDFFFGLRRTTGIGSGVIISQDGYILTNNHVVQDADEIWVTVRKKDIKGRVIGKDYETDIAVVKVDMEGLPAVRLGSVRDLEVGELVVAIGSPYGFEHSVTAGVVSALYRQLTVSSNLGYITFTDLIQTDAAINPGNSGGALCNTKGEVVGINTLIYSETGGYQGIGFAIPIDVAKDVADQLIKEGKVSHPYVGVNGQDVDRELAKEYGLTVEKGAFILQIYPDTPAEKAGLKRGDVVVEFNGEVIESMYDLIAAIRKRKVGDVIEIVIVRDGERIKKELTLAEKPTLFKG